MMTMRSRKEMSLRQLWSLDDRAATELYDRERDMEQNIWSCEERALHEEEAS